MTEQSIPQDPETNTISVKRTSTAFRLRKAVGLLDAALDAFGREGQFETETNLVIDVFSAKLLIEFVIEDLEA